MNNALQISLVWYRVDSEARLDDAVLRSLYLRRTVRDLGSLEIFGEIFEEIFENKHQTLICRSDKVLYPRYMITSKKS